MVRRDRCNLRRRRLLSPSGLAHGTDGRRPCPRRLPRLSLPRIHLRHDRPVRGHSQCPGTQGCKAQGLPYQGDPRPDLRLVGRRRAVRHSGNFRRNRPPARSGAGCSPPRSGSAAIPRRRRRTPSDVEHLEYTHGYSNVRPTEMLIDGAYLKSAFDFTSVRRTAGLFDIVADVSAVAHLHGLGYSFVEIHEKGIGMHSRMWVLSSPVDGTLVDLTLATQVHEIRKPGQFFKGLGFLPVSLRHRLMARLFIKRGKTVCGAGRGHLGPEALPVAPAPVPCRRPDREVPAVLPSVLS